MKKNDDDFNKILEEKLNRESIPQKEDPYSLDDAVEKLFAESYDGLETRQVDGRGSDDESVKPSLELLDEAISEESIHSKDSEIKQDDMGSKENYILSVEQIEDKFSKKERNTMLNKSVGVIIAICVGIGGVSAGGYYYLEHSGSDNMIVASLQEALGIKTPNKSEKVLVQKEKIEEPIEKISDVPKADEEISDKEPEQDEKNERKLEDSDFENDKESGTIIEQEDLIHEEIENENQGYKSIYENAIAFCTVKINANLYKTPLIEEISDSEVVSIPQNLVVALIEQTSINGEKWSHINYFSLDGWMKDEELEDIGEKNFSSEDFERVFINIPFEEVLDVHDKGMESAEVIAEVTYGQEVNLLKTENGWANILIDGIEGWVPSVSVSVYRPGYFYVNTENKEPMNLRGEASFDGNIVSAVANGTKLEITEFKNGWGKIMGDDKEGWLNLRYLTPCNADFVSTTITASPVQVGNTRTNSNANSNPNSNYTPSNMNPNPNSTSPQEEVPPNDLPDDTLQWEDEPSDIIPGDELQWEEQSSEDTSDDTLQ